MVVGRMLAAAMLLGAVANAALFALVWGDRDEPGARWFVALLPLLTTWCLAEAISLVTTDPTLTRLFDVLVWGSSALVPVTWLGFTLAYTGRSHLVTRRHVVALSLLPATTVPALLTNDLHHLAYTDGRIVAQGTLSVFTYESGPWLVLVMAFMFLLVATSFSLLVSFFWSTDGRYRKTLALTGTLLLPALTSAKAILEVGPYPLIDFTPLTLALLGPTVGYLLLHYDLFHTRPAIRHVGRRAALDDFGDGVVILDEDERVVDLNAAAQHLLDTGERVLGRSVDDLFGTDELDLTDTSGIIRMETNRGRRGFALSVSEISDRADHHLGYTIVLHDVTDEKQRQQRLEVLNRILRHNLRNAMTAVMGYARRLEDHADEEGRRMADRIQAQSTELVDLSEKAREIDRVTDPSRVQERFEVGDAFESVEQRVVADHDDVTVTTTVPGALTMTSDRVIVEEILRYAAEVLLSYDDASDPRLVFSATPTDASRPWLEVTVTSDGDPVPVEEREVIERGEETPLEHSRDLELWLVSWGVETLGGDLHFIEDDDRPGISLSIPDFEQAADGSGVRDFRA
ncbi:histidine kinase N-terminal 7TM domain-containing protein [Halobacteriales archaeon Cl-PHB]